LRADRIFTIDPPTAKDLDDALSIKLLSDGNFEVGVHIADVSFFVDAGSMLDTEASEVNFESRFFTHPCLSGQQQCTWYKKQFPCFRIFCAKTCAVSTRELTDLLSVSSGN
jgi:hypothetical protein